eukprot:869828-Rhodomonas_salina.1
MSVPSCVRGLLFERHRAIWPTFDVTLDSGQLYPGTDSSICYPRNGDCDPESGDCYPRCGDSILWERTNLEDVGDRKGGRKGRSVGCRDLVSPYAGQYRAARRPIGEPRSVLGSA